MFIAVLDSPELEVHAQILAEHAESYAGISYSTMDLLDTAVEKMHSVNKGTDAKVFETENRQKAFQIFAEVLCIPGQHVHTRMLVEPATPTIKFSQCNRVFRTWRATTQCCMLEDSNWYHGTTAATISVIPLLV